MELQCSTMFHRASPGTLGRTIEQHGVRLVQHSAGQIAKHLRPEDLDMIAPILLPKFSMAFLDKALALRLESIQAQQLVNALGRAERLGYDVRDVVTGTAPASGAARQEKVIPTANPIPVPPASLMPGRPGAQPPPQPPQVPQNRGPSSPSAGLPSDQDIMRLGIAFCDKCNRPCGGFKALLAHQRSGLCGSLPVPVENLGKDYCLFCGQRFIGGGGLTYHTKNNVCGHYTEENADALIKLFHDAHEVLRRRAEGGGPPSKGRPPAAAAAARQSVAQESPSQGSKDPYAALSPNTRLAFDAAMAIVEHKFAEELKKASTFPAHAQKAEIARVKNLYNNKQSMTRKKFGIRLRERRSRSEIDEERARMLSSRPDTPASTGKRAFSEVDGTPAATGERDSASTQGTPKRVLLTETANGAAAAGGSPTTADRADSASTATSPVVSRPAALVKAGATPRPVPMSIAGSYTAPIQVPNAAMGNTPTDGKTPIEIDDDEEEEDEEEGEEEDDETADEDANGNQSDMEVDE